MIDQHDPHTGLHSEHGSRPGEQADRASNPTPAGLRVHQRASQAGA